MTLHRFLDAAYTLLVEGYTSVAPNRLDLLTAVQKVEAAWQSEPDKPRAAHVPSQNDQALAQLQAMMAGVQRV